MLIQRSFGSLSSTFLDMKRERNDRRRLREIDRASFQDIDLRWGVSDEGRKTREPSRYASPRSNAPKPNHNTPG